MHGDIKGTGSQKRDLERGGWGSFVKCLFTYMKGSDSEDEKSSLKTGIVLGEKLAGIEACRGQFQERERERTLRKGVVSSGWSLICAPLGYILHSPFARQSNHEHVFLQGEDKLYMSTGDTIWRASSHQHASFWGGSSSYSNGSHPFIGNKQWQIIPISHSYLASNWPIRVSHRSGHTAPQLSLVCGLTTLVMVVM